MSTRFEIHSQQRVMGLENRRTDDLVSCTGSMRLNIGILRLKDFLGPINGQLFERVKQPFFCNFL